MPSEIFEMASECKRLSESCLYTSTSLFIWLRWCRWLKTAFIVLPLILGSLSTWNVLTQSASPHSKEFTAVCAFLAGVLPAVYAALKLDAHLERCCHLAGEFKNLQDRFRQAALIFSKLTFAQFDSEFGQLVDRLEAARATSFTTPEWCFRKAQAKIKQGDYDFDVDVPRESHKESRTAAVPYLVAEEADHTDGDS